jgi:Ca2+-binding EF-hand superfamily protein
MGSSAGFQITPSIIDGLVQVYSYSVDLNGDGTVDMKDIGYVARRFMCTPSDPLWDPIPDINGDDKIDMKDISTIARHFMEHYP